MARREIALIAAASTVAVAFATRTRAVQHLDDALERRAGSRRPRIVRAARIASLPGESFMHPTIGAVVCVAVLALRGGRIARVVVPLGAASLGAIVAHHGIKAVYRRPRPAIALGRGKTEPAFPSGHTADSTAVLATGAYVLVKEGILAAEVAIPAAVFLSAMTGASRVALGWHWGTDVLGGWLTGIGVAAGATALYDVLSSRPSVPRTRRRRWHG
jgi:undecaprenyl-diphosphatase